MLLIRILLLTGFGFGFLSMLFFNKGLAFLA